MEPTAHTERAMATTQSPQVGAAVTTFRLTLAYMTVMTLVWGFLNVTGADGGLFFRDYRVTGEVMGRVLAGFLIFWVSWSWMFYRLKRTLLKRAGFGDRELELAFSNRLTGFDLASLIAPYSERRIRIADMVGRRGRTFAMVFVGFYFVYKGLGANPSAESLAFGLWSNLIDGMVFAWWGLITFHSNGILGRIHYGAQARVMDGVLGRANALCIGTLWHAFKFAMIPLGFALAKVFPPETYAAVFALIWYSYLSCDFASEIFGALFGKQTIQVFGLGDVNKKSVVGTVSGFAAALLVNSAIVFANGLPSGWYGLAIVLALTSTALELWSPRGTDDFTMATGNAVVCWAFGAWVL
jgi:dolichol kinase